MLLCEYVRLERVRDATCIKRLTLVNTEGNGEEARRHAECRERTWSKRE
jgi:hypothetical protein